MSGCSCDNPTDFRATSENAGDDYLYLRCGSCGGKAGRVSISLEELEGKVTNPEDLDTERPEVAEKIVDRGVPTVSIHFERNDHPLMFKDS